MRDEREYLMSRKHADVEKHSHMCPIQHRLFYSVVQRGLQSIVVKMRVCNPLRGRKGKGEVKHMFTYNHRLKWRYVILVFTEEVVESCMIVFLANNRI